MQRDWCSHLEDMIKFATTEHSEYKQLLFMHTLAAKVDAKNPLTVDHRENVAQYAKAIAKALNYSEEDLNNLYTAAILHDIGKIGVPDSILLKRNSLTEEEWTIVKTHPRCGYSLLKAVKSLETIVDTVHSHHERYDGHGYPRGLQGEQIPRFARILAVADSYDAMTSSRPYSQRMDPRQALAELRRCSGTQFDPEIVTVFLMILRKGFNISSVPQINNRSQKTLLADVH